MVQTCWIPSSHVPPRSSRRAELPWLSHDLSPVPTCFPVLSSKRGQLRVQVGSPEQTASGGGLGEGMKVVGEGVKGLGEGIRAVGGSRGGRG